MTHVSDPRKVVRGSFIVLLMALTVAAGLAVVGSHGAGVPGPALAASALLPAPRAATFYPVTFTESGLKAGTTWVVELNRTPSNSGTTEIIFAEPNGTYNFTLVPPVGYAANVTNGSVTVRGGPASAEIGFSPATEPPAPSTGSGGIPLWLWVVVVLVVVLAAVAAYFGLRERKPPPSEPAAPATPRGPAEVPASASPRPPESPPGSS